MLVGEFNGELVFARMRRLIGNRAGAVFVVFARDVRFGGTFDGEGEAACVCVKLVVVKFVGLIDFLDDTRKERLGLCGRNGKGYYVRKTTSLAVRTVFIIQGV